ncbi:MAG: hypothetical protein WBQ25_06740 [Nitrososphaeraceae archaeon]
MKRGYTLGDEEKSERASEVKKEWYCANTSCSLFILEKKGSKRALPVGSLQNYTDLTQAENQLTFHLLIDIGKGVLNSLQSIKNISDLLSILSNLTLTHLSLALMLLLPAQQQLQKTHQSPFKGHSIYQTPC